MPADTVALQSAPAVAPLRPVGPAPAPSRPRQRRDAGSLLADLHERHATELLRFCRWMLRDPDDAPDALQDTWIRAMSALSDDRVRVAALRPWLYSIARNVCLDRLRDRKRASLQDLDETTAGDTPGADEVASLRQEASAALALVGSLSERQRSALLMRELAGMSVPEIATTLGLSADRAAWTINDARRALDEARAGSTLECQDAQVRLGAGHRGRTLRAHLEQCGLCRSHDRKLRARRVLAPALLPFLWLRRLSWPTLVKPAAATVVAALAVTSVPHLVPRDRAGTGGRPPRLAATGPRHEPMRAPVGVPAAAVHRSTPAPRRAAVAPSPAPVAIVASTLVATSPAASVVAPAPAATAEAVPTERAPHVVQVANGAVRSVVAAGTHLVAGAVGAATATAGPVVPAVRSAAAAATSVLGA